MLTEEDKADRHFLHQLFRKRKTRDQTKEGFFYFEDQEFMIAQGQETYIVVARDMAIGYPLFMRGEQDLSKLTLALDLVSANYGRIETLWDIGANIGSVCIPAVKRGLVKKAVAFEPEKRLFKLLRANTILNSVDECILVLNTALGDKRGSVELTMGENNTGDYRISGLQFDDDAMGESTRQRVSIDIRPMDDFLDIFDVNSTLLFMDIQGYEGFALNGGRHILSKSPPLVVEFWPYAMKRLGSFATFRDTLCAGPYERCFDLSDHSKTSIPLEAETLNELYSRIGEEHTSSTDILFI
jgi:FkbM family methyltransferase